jgi:hypothetical protein
MSATTTQLLSSGEFCKLRYDTKPVKIASANVSFYTNNSKNAKFPVVTLFLQMSDICTGSLHIFYEAPQLRPRKAGNPPKFGNADYANFN